MTIVLIAVLVAGIAIVAYAIAAPRFTKAARERREQPVLHADAGWTNGAGDEFGGLPEAARCDLVFAVAALDDERSRALLDHALDDPAEAVALAAAHALAARGDRLSVENYLAAHPGPRAERIAQTLSLLGSTDSAS